jgi:outer membrane protein assembly factor BamB
MKKIGWLFLFAFIFPLIFLEIGTNDFILFSTPEIFVDPTVTTNYVGYIFSVDVNITNVNNMWSWNFTLYYNKTLLYCKYAQAFNASGWTSYTQVGPTIEQNFNSTHGRVRASMSATSGSEFSGSMVIATIYFNVTAVTGSCPLDITDTLIKDKSGSLVAHEVYDGTFQTGQYTKVTFRFLGVESGDDEEFRSSQQLIQNLTRFLNWQNVTWGKYNYTSYVHLLSNASNAWSLPYYVGEPTKANVKSEIQNFLGVTGPGENNSLTVRIFHFCDHGGKLYAGNGTYVPSLQLEKYYVQNNTVHQVLTDSELNETLNSGDLKNSNCTVVILDCCYAGGFINKTARQGRVILTACKWEEKSLSWYGQSLPPPGYWSWFTGNQDAQFGNYTVYGPLGIIGGLFNADDENCDNWMSAGEIFDFANRTTIEYSTGENQRTGSNVFHPQKAYGVIHGGVPIIMYDKYWSWLCLWMPWGENFMEPAEFPYNSKATFPFVTILHTWEMLGKNSRRVSYAPSRGPTQPSLFWNKMFEGFIKSSTAISNQIVVLGSENGILYAMDIRTGETLWNFDAGAPIQSSPAVVDGIVFFGTDSGKIYALDEGTGLVRWVYITPSSASISSSPAVSNNTVFIGSSDGRLYALDETSGYPVWNFSTGAGIGSSPAVSNDMVFVGSVDGIIHALNMTDGTLKWNYPILPSSPIVSSPAVAEPMVYVTSMNGGVYALDLSGHFQWYFDTGGPITSSPTVDEAKNLVILGSQDGYVYALNRMTGGPPVWSTYVGIVEWSSPAISGNDLIYIGTTNNLFHCLNETSGAVVWSYSVSGPIYASAALTDEHVVISSYDGTLYCFGPEFPYHDVAVSSLEVSPTTVTQGQKITISYNITNFGNRIETFNVTIAYNTTEIWTPPLYLQPTSIHNETITLQPGQTITLTYEWDTTGKTPGKYTIVVLILPIEYESNTTNNARGSETITIKPLSISRGGSSKMPLLK